MSTRELATCPKCAGRLVKIWQTHEVSCIFHDGLQKWEQVPEDDPPTPFYVTCDGPGERHTFELVFDLPLDALRALRASISRAEAQHCGLPEILTRDG